MAEKGAGVKVFLQRVRRDRRMDREHDVVAADLGDRYEVLQGIVRQARETGIEIHHARDADDQERVAVRRGLGDIFAGDQRIGTGLILDDRRLGQPLGKLLGCRRAFKSDQLCALNFDQGL